MKNRMIKSLLMTIGAVSLITLANPIDGLANEKTEYQNEYTVTENGRTYIKDISSVPVKLGIARVEEKADRQRSIYDNFKGSTIAANKTGKCGYSVYYRLDGNGKLTISGSGDMWTFDMLNSDYHECPWRAYKNAIKSVVFERGVTLVGDYALFECSNLSTVQFSDTIIGIGHYAFMRCSNLQNFTLPPYLQTLGQQCFCECTKITSVVVPKTVTAMLGSIFEDDTNLKYVYIKADPTIPSFLMSSGTFSGCSKLENINVEKGHLGLSSIDGVLFSSDKKYLYDYPVGRKANRYVVPSTTKTIFQSAFREASNLEHIVLPEGLYEIYGLTFQYCSKLKELVIPSSVRVLGELNGENLFAINYVENKSNVTLNLASDNYINLWVDENGKEITSLGKGKAYPHYLIWDITAKNQSVKEGSTIDLSKAYNYVVNYKDTVEKKNPPDLIFESLNSKVAAVSKDGKVTAKTPGTAKIKIFCKYFRGKTANCAKDVTIEITVKKDINKASVSKVATQVFTGKAKKPQITVTYLGKVLKKDIDYKVSYKNNKNIGRSTIVIDGKGSFLGTLKKSFKIAVQKGKTYTVNNMKYSVTNADTNGKGTVSLIGTTSKKSKLTSLSIGSSVKIGGVSFKITAIGEKAFKGYTKLKKLTIGTNVKTIQAQAFYGCNSLKTLSIKSTKLNKLGASAFTKLPKNATIKAPSKKISSYKKLIKQNTGNKGFRYIKL